MDYAEPWPLRQLVLRTPRLELRPDDDAGLYELIEQIHAGIHPPDEMPFANPFTDAAPADIGPNTLRFYWRSRADCTLQAWAVHFLVRLDGRVIGTQEVKAKDFAVTREVSTGSWIGQRYQGHGYGAEMRAAVLMFAFDHLGATQARSAAFVQNQRSHGVSRRLGYQPDGTEVLAVRERRQVDVRLLVTRERFAEHRPSWQLETEGVAACLPFLASGEIPTNEP